MERIAEFIDKYLTVLHIPKHILVTDYVEIVIISFLVYQILVWVRNTKAWAFLKGMLVIFAFLLVAAIFRIFNSLSCKGPCLIYLLSSHSLTHFFQQDL